MKQTLHYRPSIAFILLLSSFLLVPRPGKSQASAADSLLLQQLISAFQDAIVEKDSLAFHQLFFSPSVSFVGIMSPQTEWSIKKDHPEFQGVAVSTQRRFIAEICRSPKAQREDFFNLAMATDGMIGTIVFDYGFYAGPRLMQWGNERWQLVKEDGRWLITDVVYSIRFPDIEPFPFGE